MLCIEVWVNGERQCTAGVDEFGRLTANLNFHDWSAEKMEAILTDCDEDDDDDREIFNPELRVYGSTSGEPYQILTWMEQAVKKGDEITLRIVEAEKPDAAEIYEPKE